MNAFPHYRDLLSLLLLLSLFIGFDGGIPVSAREVDRVSTPIRLLVPAGSEIRIDGDRMKLVAVNEERNFVSPPLVSGKQYRYEVQVSHNGRLVQKTVRFTAGVAVEIDFRPDFKPGDRDPSGEWQSPYKPLRRREPRILIA